jgi:hypothetical protein
VAWLSWVPAFRLRAPRFGGLVPAEAREASVGWVAGTNGGGSYLAVFDIARVKRGEESCLALRCSFARRTQHLVRSNGANFFARAGCKKIFIRRKIVQVRFISTSVERSRKLLRAAPRDRRRKGKQLATPFHPRSRLCEPRCCRQRAAGLRRLPQREHLLRKRSELAARFRSLWLALPDVRGTQGRCGPATRQADAKQRQAHAVLGRGRSFRAPLTKASGADGRAGL